MAKKKNKPDMLVGTVTLSKMFGVTSRTVQRLAQEGVLPKSEGKEGNANLYRLDKSVQAYIHYLESLAEQRADKADQNEALKEQKIIAETELKKSQLKFHRLKVDTDRRKYIIKPMLSMSSESSIRYSKSLLCAFLEEWQLLLRDMLTPLY